MSSISTLLLLLTCFTLTSALSLRQRLSTHLSSYARSQLSAEEYHSIITGDLPNPVIGYRFDGGYYTDLNGANAATKVPAGATNIQIVNNNARNNMVLQRTASNSQTNSYLSIPASLTQQFSIGIWISWSGVPSPTGDSYIIGTDDVQIYIDATGNVKGRVATTTITDPTPLIDDKWIFYTLTYDGTTASLYRNGQSVASNVATYITSSKLIAVGNGGTLSSNVGYFGSIDDIRIYNVALDEIQVLLIYQATKTGSMLGGAPILLGNNRWWGHLFTSQVQFQNRIAEAPTGDIRITGSFIDCSIRTTNLLWIRMFGVTGISQYTSIPGIGQVTWDAPTYTLIIQPIVPVGEGVPFTYLLPGNALNLRNPPISNAATNSDTRWQMAITLDPDQTTVPGGKLRKQGLRWQPILYTPATIDPNPAFIEDMSEIDEMNEMDVDIDELLDSEHDISDLGLLEMEADAEVDVDAEAEAELDIDAELDDEMDMEQEQE